MITAPFTDAPVTMDTIVQGFDKSVQWVEASADNLPPKAINWLTACLRFPYWIEAGYMDGSSSDLAMDSEAEPVFEPTRIAEQLAAILDEERIGTLPMPDGRWMAVLSTDKRSTSAYGATRAEAALRAFVLKYLGRQVRVPQAWAD